MTRWEFCWILYNLTRSNFTLRRNTEHGSFPYLQSSERRRGRRVLLLTWRVNCVAASHEQQKFFRKIGLFIEPRCSRCGWRNLEREKGKTCSSSHQDQNQNFEKSCGAHSCASSMSQFGDVSSGLAAPQTSCRAAAGSLCVLTPIALTRSCSRYGRTVTFTGTQRASDLKKPKTKQNRSFKTGT